jgi:hypothetical protein
MARRQEGSQPEKAPLDEEFDFKRLIKGEYSKLSE